MNPIKKLAGQTAIYGLSSIVARFLYYLLVPLHTAMFATNEYGIVTEMYSYVSFLVVVLLYGMETAYFRYSNKDDIDKNSVYTTVTYSIVTTTVLFVGLVSLYAQPIAGYIKYPDNAEYIVWFALIVGMDALSSIPMARLRAENKAKRFAVINIANVAVNIALNLFFLGYCMVRYNSGHSNIIIDTCYNPNIGVGYIFIANLVASAVKFLMLVPEIMKARYRFDPKLLKTLLVYAFPLLIFGLAGIVNETLDRLMIKWMLYDRIGQQATMSQLGIYGACYKVSIIITLFIQAFRYAAEPFFFAHDKAKGSLEVYSKIMNYFVIVCATIFLGVLLYLDIFKHFVDSKYWDGLGVVPILMAANICLGIYYNQSVWYKLTGKTMWGAYLGLFGAGLTIVLNYLWIPAYGYIGSAWATLICYAAMMTASYVSGQKHYPIPYNIKRIFIYLGSAGLLYFISEMLPVNGMLVKYAVNTVLFMGFITLVYLIEKPFGPKPAIGR